jgi:AcrR family transcriptional regulator
MPTAAARAPRHDRTATAILDAAAHRLAERGATASMADVAAAAGVSRATLYRYYPSRSSLLEALAAAAVADAGARIADAGLDRVPIDEALERIVRAIVTVGDHYAVVLHEQVQPDPAEVERQLGAPIRAVFARGVDSGALRSDLPVEILLSLLGAVLTAAIDLGGHGRLGLEDTVAAATAFFLDGARAR